MSSFKSLPASEKPRERLLQHGPSSLSTTELLAILLGSGTKKTSVIHLAENLLSHFQSLQNLANASIQELTEVNGIGLAKAIQLHAVFSLAARKETPDHQILDTPKKIYEYIRHDLEFAQTEHLLIVLRDVRLKGIHKEILSKGSLTSLLTHPREIFHVAIKHRAHSIILAHNHPSGDPSPSMQDMELTKHLKEASKLMGIAIADHLIIGKRCFYSFTECCVCDLGN